jgi:methionyl-tRNA formyltransferase
MNKKKRIIFFGTPEFSLAPLKTLYLGGYQIVGIYTQEPKKKSRGLKIKKTPVHEWAESQLLPVFYPDKLNSKNLKLFKELRPDIAILFAYGKIIPQSWLDIPLFGFINIHASLLPKWRGAAPIQRAIENNDKKTGITIMKMNDKLDEGPILNSKELKINSLTNGKNLTELISQDACSVLFNTLDNYLKGNLIPLEQDSSNSSYAHKIDKNECEINWHEDSLTIERKIRAFYPRPTMWFRFQGKRFKVLSAHTLDINGDPGLILDSKKLTIACGKGSICINEIQAEGKNPMKSEAFILGNNNFLSGTNLIA